MHFILFLNTAVLNNFVIIIACSSAVFTIARNSCQSFINSIDCGTVACQSHQYGCTNGRCIYREWLCDGVADCPLADDEVPSLCSKTTMTRLSALY